MSLLTSSASTRPSASPSATGLSREPEDNVAARTSRRPSSIVNASGHAPQSSALTPIGGRPVLAFRPYPCLVWLRPVQEDVACPTQTARTNSSLRGPLARLDRSREELAKAWLVRVIGRASLDEIKNLPTDRIAAQLPDLFR